MFVIGHLAHMRIRPEQKRELAAQQTEQFVRKMMVHARKYYPKETARMNDSALAGEVREAIQAAEPHGMVSEREVCAFLNFRLEFGPAFEKLPWAAPILRDPWADKAERLYQASLNRPTDTRPSLG